jgi:hypothetical protein
MARLLFGWSVSPTWRPYTSTETGNRGILRSRTTAVSAAQSWFRSEGIVDHLVGFIERRGVGHGKVFVDRLENLSQKKYCVLAGRELQLLSLA